LFFLEEYKPAFNFINKGLGKLDMKLFLYYEAISIYGKYAYRKDPSFNDFSKSLVQSIIVNDVHKLGTHLMLSIEPVPHSL
jgi:hypothetical protein